MLKLGVELDARTCPGLSSASKDVGAGIVGDERLIQDRALHCRWEQAGHQPWFPTVGEVCRAEGPGQEEVGSAGAQFPGFCVIECKGMS